ncbi:diaminobutyrate acetyltransferase [Acinetobacter calcoaceticus]|uniref:diaminobutyrate acetyltransferase n=1 Tax=Acinetobacter calcoaceticus TaxID=471 RepID=UPI001E42FF33|nr:diaminobutyrate acetyltransferase [Acinetobacter calcoaceticus]UGQ29353.1 diaminobutyrate acetyltransferase [Acinetobacter calcoaceticus]
MEALSRQSLRSTKQSIIHQLNQYNVRNFQPQDVREVHALIQSCPSLDLNSLYAYALLAEHHTDTCLVAYDHKGQICGVVTGYICPEEPDTYFLWQIAVSPTEQGKGIGSLLLDNVREQCLEPRQLKRLKTTISPSNKASQNLFRSFASRFDVDCRVSPFLSKQALQPLEPEPFETQHEPEDLYTLGRWDWN